MIDTAIVPRIPRDHAASIGYVAYHWSLVEGRVAHLISNLLDLDYHAGHAATAELPMLARINLAHTLIGLTGDLAFINEWQAIENDLDAARVERNDIVHAEWMVVGAENYRARYKAKRQVSVTFFPVPTEDLDRLSERMAEIADRITALLLKMIRARAHKVITGPNPPGPPPTPSPSPSPSPKPPSPDRIPRAKRKAARKAAISAKG